MKTKLLALVIALLPQISNAFPASESDFVCTANGAANFREAEYPLVYVRTGAYPGDDIGAWVILSKANENYNDPGLPLIKRNRDGSAVFEKSGMRVEYDNPKGIVYILMPKKRLSLKCNILFEPY